jgi:hypothetical protein
MPRKFNYDEVRLIMFGCEALDISNYSKRIRSFIFVAVQLFFMMIFYMLIIEPTIKSISEIDIQLLKNHRNIQRYENQLSQLIEMKALKQKIVSELQLFNDKQSTTLLSKRIENLANNSGLSQIQIVQQVSGNTILDAKSITLQAEGDFQMVCLFLLMLSRHMERQVQQKMSLSWLEDKKTLLLFMELDYVFFVENKD